jgi:hypothetical protein
MAPGVLSSACLATAKPCRQAAHPADLRSPQTSIWGEDMDNLPVPTSLKQTGLLLPRVRHAIDEESLAEIWGGCQGWFVAPRQKGGVGV